MQREGVCHPICREERHTLLCDEKSLSTPFIEERHSPPSAYNRGALSPLSREDTLSSVQRRSLPPLQIAEGALCPLWREITLSPVYRQGGCLPSTDSRGTLSSPCAECTLSSVSRRSLPPLHITEGQSHLCVEKTRSPLYREGGGALSPLCAGDTLYSVWRACPLYI